MMLYITKIAVVAPFSQCQIQVSGQLRCHNILTKV